MAPVSSTALTPGTVPNAAMLAMAPADTVAGGTNKPLFPSATTPQASYYVIVYVVADSNVFTQ